MTSKLTLISSIAISFILLILLFILFQFKEPQIIYKSILLGNASAFLNFLLGIFFILFGVDKSPNIFLQSVFAGVLVRLVILLTIVILTLKFLEINDFSYIFSLLFFYIFYVIIEVIYLILRKRSRTQ
jgi:hypothetical protein